MIVRQASVFGDMVFRSLLPVIFLCNMCLATVEQHCPNCACYDEQFNATCTYPEGRGLKVKVDDQPFSIYVTSSTGFSKSMNSTLVTLIEHNSTLKTVMIQHISTNKPYTEIECKDTEDNNSSCRVAHENTPEPPADLIINQDKNALSISWTPAPCDAIHKVLVSITSLANGSIVWTREVDAGKSEVTVSPLDWGKYLVKIITVGCCRSRPVDKEVEFVGGVPDPPKEVFVTVNAAIPALVITVLVNTNGPSVESIWISVYLNESLIFTVQTTQYTYHYKLTNSTQVSSVKVLTTNRQGNSSIVEKKISFPFAYNISITKEQWINDTANITFSLCMYGLALLNHSRLIVANETSVENFETGKECTHHTLQLAIEMEKIKVSAVVITQDRVTYDFSEILEINNSSDFHDGSTTSIAHGCPLMMFTCLFLSLAFLIQLIS